MNRRAVKFTLSVLALAALSLDRGPELLASDNVSRVTVTATGTATVKPDTIEVHSAVTYSAALASEALKKYRDGRRRAIAALERLKLKDLKIEGNGPLLMSANPNVQQGVVMVNGVQVDQSGASFTVSEPMSIRISSIDRLKDEEMLEILAKVVDAAKDAGMSVQAEGIEYRSTKIAETRKAAAQAAMQSAREKAATLAGLSNKKVDQVDSINEMGIAEMPNQPIYEATMVGNIITATPSTPVAVGAVASKPRAISVSVTLNVVFTMTGGK